MNNFMIQHFHFWVYSQGKLSQYATEILVVSVIYHILHSSPNTVSLCANQLMNS